MQSEDEIRSHYQNMTKKEGCDPILVGAQIMHIRKRHKITGKEIITHNIGLKLYPVIVTEDRYVQFVKTCDSELNYIGNGEYEKIFWFKPNSGMKSTVDLFDTYKYQINSFFEKLATELQNVAMNEKGGILLP